jgi:hypothetical protein
MAVDEGEALLEGTAMSRTNKGLSFFRVARAVAAGLVVGLLLGVAVHCCTTPQQGAASVFAATDRFGRPTAVRVEGHLPAYAALPLAGAVIGLFWLPVRDLFRGE